MSSREPMNLADVLKGAVNEDLSLSQVVPKSASYCSDLVHWLFTNQLL